jgi:hypothetical protein
LKGNEGSTVKAPAPTKGKTVERVERGMRSNSTGGDSYSRMKGKYSKNQQDRSNEPVDY